MIHVVGRWQNTNDIRHATTNDSDQEGQRRIPNSVQLSTVRSAVTYVQNYRDFELALGAARAVPSCCSHGHAPWLAFCAH